MEKGAIFSDDRVYRYVLWRIWDTSLPAAMFVSLNASTADEFQDDPTIRRDVGFANAWGYGGLFKLNIFGFCSTDPKKLRYAIDPVGPENNAYLLTYAEKSAITVLAYGTHGKLRGRGQIVKDLLTSAGYASKLRHLGLTKDGYPKHPLYLRGDTLPQLYT